MSGEREPKDVPAETSALARRNHGLFAAPELRDAIRGMTGLSEEGVDQVAEGLTRLGVGLVLPNGADMKAKNANAINLVRHHRYSVVRAAREVGISATHLTRKLNAIGSNGDLQKKAATGDERILEMSQAMATLAGETILDRLEREGDEMKIAELTKVYSASTNQVAAKQRWSQGGSRASGGDGMSILTKILAGKVVTVSDMDPANTALDVTPKQNSEGSDEDRTSAGGER